MVRRLRFALVALAAVVVIGTAGYMIIERWPVLDALYMTVITIGTVGFSEVHAMTAVGRLFTMALIFIGFGAILFSLGTIVDFMVEGHFTGLLEVRRMNKRIAGATGHHVVAGLGRVGSVVAKEYSDRGLPFVVIDADDAALQRARERGWMYVRGDASDESTLEAAGIPRAVSLVAALDTDADNVFVTLSARGMNPDLFIVARATTASAEAKLRRAGADRVLAPTEIGGRRMAAMAVQRDVSDYLDIVMRGDGVRFKLGEIRLRDGDPYVGRTIAESQLRETTGAHILAIRSDERAMDTNPRPDVRLAAGDRLIVIGTEDQIAALTADRPPL